MGIDAKKLKKLIWTLAKVGVSLLLLFLLFRRIDIGALLVYYKNIKYGYLLIGVLLLSTQSLLSSIKWKYILQSDNSHLGLLFLWKTYLIGGFLSLFLPSSIGGDFYRIYAVNDASQSLSKSTSSVLFDRLSGLFAMVSIAFVSSLFLPGNRYTWVTISLYTALVVGFLIGTSDYVVDKLNRYAPRWANFFVKMLGSFNAYRNDRKKLVLILGIAFLFQFLIVVINKFYTLALGMDIPFRQLLVIIPLIYMTEALPISINGFGVRESAFAFFFTLIGMTGEEGLAVSLLAIFIRYLMGIVGGILLLISSIKPKPKKEEEIPGVSAMDQNI